MQARPSPLRGAAVVLLALFALALHAGAPAQPAPLNDARLARAAAEPQNWPTVGGTYAEARYSALDPINLSTVSRLKLAWYADFETNRGQQATPLVIDGVLYTSSSWSHVYAYDAATGRPLWHHDPKVPGTKGPHACCDAVNRGLAAYARTGAERQRPRRHDDRGSRCRAFQARPR